MRRLLLMTCLVASAAFADVPPPDTDGCSGKDAGVACKKDDQSNGACTNSTCSRLDYSHGTPPTSVTYDCLVCTSDVSGPADAGSSTDQKPNTCAVGGGGALIALAALLSRRKK